MWSASLTRPVGVLITLMEPATPQRNAQALEDHPLGAVPQDLECAACSPWPVGVEPAPTLRTPRSTPSPPRMTGTPAPTLTARLAMTSVSSGKLYERERQEQSLQ